MVLKRSMRRAMGLPHKMRRRGGSMRGSTPEKVFQTVDIGTGHSPQKVLHAHEMAEKIGLKRTYAIVEQKFILGAYP